jgi:hypothetical protein
MHEIGCLGTDVTFACCAQLMVRLLSVKGFWAGFDFKSIANALAHAPDTHRVQNCDMCLSDQPDPDKQIATWCMNGLCQVHSGVEHQIEPIDVVVADNEGSPWNISIVFEALGYSHVIDWCSVESIVTKCRTLQPFLPPGALKSLSMKETIKYVNKLAQHQVHGFPVALTNAVRSIKKLRVRGYALSSMWTEQVFSGPPEDGVIEVVDNLCASSSSDPVTPVQVVQPSSTQLRGIPMVKKVALSKHPIHSLKTSTISSALFP